MDNNSLVIITALKLGIDLWYNVNNAKNQFNYPKTDVKLHDFKILLNNNIFVCQPAWETT